MDLLDFVRNVYALHHPECGGDALYQLECAVRVLNRQHGRNVTVEDLSEELILSHLRWLNVQGRAPATRHRRRVHFLSMWALAVKKKLNFNPISEADIPKPPKTNDQPQAWSTAEINAMLKQAENITDGEFNGKHWKALILLIYYTGLRISAVLKLKRSNLKGHLLFVPPGIQKDKEGMSFRLPSEIANLLVALTRPNETKNCRNLAEMLIPWPWWLKSVQRRFQKAILVPAGLPVDRNLKFHAIRRTVATVIAATEGKETAMRILGHSSMKVTERYLADPSQVDPSLKSNFAPADVMPTLKVI